MKTKILLTFFLIIPFLLTAQKIDEHRNYIKYYFKNIEWGDRQYDNSIRGVMLLLKDVEKVDTELHSILNEEFEIYENNRRQANIITGVGVGVGLGFTILALNEFELFEESNAGGYFIAGVIFTAGGLLIGKSKRPNDRKFIFRFTNIFNENSQGDKVEYTIRPAIDLGNNPSLGLSFSIKF